MRAPDYVEPTLGWRVWDVIELDGAPRLCSVGFRTFWLPGREAVALCHRSLENLAWAGLSSHPAPHELCSCGIYAAQTARQATVYFTRPFLWGWSGLHRVVGPVSLWGKVVEAERGWRASHAYPAAISIPAPRPGLRSFLSGLPRPRIGVEDLAVALGDYGVPVEVVDCATGRDLAAALEAEGER